MGLLDSWRTTPRPSRPANASAVDDAELHRRIRAMDNDTLDAFLDENVGGIGRAIMHFRKMRSQEMLREAVRTIDAQREAVQELGRRGMLSVD